MTFNFKVQLHIHTIKDIGLDLCSGAAEFEESISNFVWQGPVMNRSNNSNKHIILKTHTYILSFTTFNSKKKKNFQINFAVTYDLTTIKQNISPRKISYKSCWCGHVLQTLLFLFIFQLLEIYKRNSRWAIMKKIAVRQ